MSALQTSTVRVYYAPTKGRRYLTERAAANAEAVAMIEKKYPSERAEYDNGQMYDPGWNWALDEHLVKVQKRLARRILRTLRESTRSRHEHHKQ